MRITPILLLLSFSLVTCSTNYNNPEVAINSSTYSLVLRSCYITGSEGGPSVYKLLIEFVNINDPDVTREINFTVGDKDNNPQNLSTVGEHPASSKTPGEIRFSLIGPAIYTDNHYTYKIQADNVFSIVWTEITTAPETEGRIVGKGYIHIKDQIDNSYLSAWAGEASDKNDVYPPQEIYFECSMDKD